MASSQSAQPAKCHAHVAKSLREARLDSECGAKRGNGIVVPASKREGDAKVVVDRAAARFEPDRGAICGDRFFEPALLLQRVPEVVVITRNGGVCRDRLANQIQCDRRPPRLAGDDPQHVQRIGVVGLMGKDPPVRLLRLRQPSRLMMLYPDRKCLGNGHGLHLCDSFR